MLYPSLSTYTFIVSQNAVDKYHHINNAIYVKWILDASIRHPELISVLDQPESAGWVAHRQQIEYLCQACLGDELEVRTWVADVSQTGALRKYEIVRTSDDKLIAKGWTEWLYVDITTGRPALAPLGIQKISTLKE